MRITYPGAGYHVMNRGAGRRAVFKTQAQRHSFLALLAATRERVNAEWHAYCLLGNHVHLLVAHARGQSRAYPVPSQRLIHPVLQPLREDRLKTGSSLHYCILFLLKI